MDIWVQKNLFYVLNMAEAKEENCVMSIELLSQRVKACPVIPRLRITIWPRSFSFPLKKIKSLGKFPYSTTVFSRGEKKLLSRTLDYEIEWLIWRMFPAQ